MNKQIDPKLKLVVPGYEYEGLELDVFADFGDDDYELAAVTPAGTRCPNLIPLFSDSQIDHFDRVVEQRLKADARAERFDRALDRVGPVLLRCVN